MASVWAWLRAFLLAWFARPAPALVPALEAGARYRLRLLVRMPRDVNGARLALAVALEAAGWTRVRVYLDATELEDEAWQVDAFARRFRAPEKALTWDAWADGTWTGARPYAAAITGEVTIMQVDQTLAALLQQTPVAPPPPLPVRGGGEGAAPVIGSVSTKTRPEVRLSSHLPWEFFERLRDGCYARGWKPRGLLMVMNSESGVRSTAHNANGNATGLIQFMPATLQGLGFSPPASQANGREPWQVLQQDYGPVAQLDLVFKYYDTRVPPLVADADETAFYLATYHPAQNAYAKMPGYVLTRSGGADYAANAGAFDVEKKGFITVGDLTRRIQRTATGAYWQEVSNRLQFVEDETGGGGGARIATAIAIFAVTAGLAWVGYQVVNGGIALPSIPGLPSRLPA